MSATDPIHQEILYDGGKYTRSGYEKMDADKIQKALKGAAFPYQWGVYTTAYARKQLQDAIKLCGKQIIYCDTDSVKTLGDVPIEKLNDALRKRAEAVCAYADDKNGKRHYIGLFESDGLYREFITQGAKRYAYIKPNGQMEITVSGVSTAKDEKTEWIDETGEKYNPSFAVEELGSLDRFHPERRDESGNVIDDAMKWVKAGGVMAVYHDKDDFDYTDPETGNIVHISGNVSIVPSTYIMTHSKDYKALLSTIQLYEEYRRERE